MKAKTFILATGFIRENAAAFMDRVELNGKTQVTFSDTGSKSARQDGLWWMWCTNVADSGMGSYDTKEEVHIAAKKRWVIPIMIRDSTFFADLYSIYKQLYGKDIDKMTWFAQHQVSTTSLSVSQKAEVLTDFQRFYLGHGVPLNDPEDHKLLK